MNCDEVRPLLDAYFDSELDLTATVRVEDHLAECANCAGVLENLQRLRDELTPAVFNQASTSDLLRLGERIRRNAIPAPKAWMPPAAWVAIAAALVVAVPLTWRVANREDRFTRELVDNHVRSLTAGHLVDVPSSDQHTVKPWFQGKVDFAPEVPDFADKGFELIGGRLDFLGGRPAAAIVYKRRGHFINVWSIRTGNSDARLTFSSVDGYQIAHWATSGLDRWVATDMNSAELRPFVDYLRGQ